MNRIFQRQQRNLGDYAALGLVGLVFLSMLALIAMPEALVKPAPAIVSATQ